MSGQADGTVEGLDSAELVRKIAAIADDKLGEELVALDVRELVGYTDFLLICTARNERLAKTIGDEIRVRLKREEGLVATRVEGESEARWLLLDYLDCVVHVMVAEMRDRYRLEQLWGEAPQLDLGLPAGAERGPAPG
jgi:ribosome-associated protein